MLLRSVQLHNFGRYKDTSTIDVRITDERNIVLINGGNDRGKTTLLTAIRFALFGDQRIKPDSLINYQQARLGDGNMHVEIVFEHNDREYRLRRSVKFRQVNADDELPTIENPELSILEDEIGTDLEQEWLEHLLPNDVSQFFIFDGEQIQSYIDKAATSLKEPIEVILGIKELLNARVDIKNIQDKLDEQRRDEIATQEHKQVRLENLRKHLKKHKDDQHGLESAIKQADRDVIKYTKDLDNHDQLKKLNEKAKKIRNSIEKLKRNEKNHTDKVAEQRGNFGLFLLRPLLHMVNEAESSVVEEWESSAAHDVLEKRRCVCGRPLDAESIRVLKTKMSERTRTQYRLHEIVSKILSRYDLDEKMSDLDGALQKLRQNQDETDCLRRELDDVEKAIDATIDSEFDYDYTIKKLREAQGNVVTWKEKLYDCKERVDKAKKKIENFERNIILDTDNPKLTNIERRLVVAEDLNRAVSLAIEDFYKKRKPKLEKEISDVFIRLTNNPQFYRRLEVKDDFRIRIMREDGVSLPITRYGPSAGQAQIVATAIISGLSNFATRDAPIIIDTPLGRLDDIHKPNVIRHYSQMGRQVIILYHQSEMNDRDIQVINNNIASEWKIESIPDRAWGL